MKKLFIAFAMLFVVAFSNAQTCASPVLLDGLNGAFTTLDSFNVQNRFFKFTANNTTHTIKACIKRLSTHSGNIALNLYSNNCGSLPSSSISVTPTVSGDTIIINYSGFMQGTEYLAEINKIVNNSNYVACQVNINNGQRSVVWGCPAGGPCPVTNTCELVCNGSFEQTSGVPISYGTITNAYNWGDASNGTSDLMCTLSPANTPVNTTCGYPGALSPYSGACSTNNYYSSSIVETNYSNSQHYTEYIQTKLTNTLQAGKSYIISFYISRGTFSNGYLNSIGIWLTPGQLTSPGTGPITSPSPVAVNSNTTLLNNTGGWSQVVFCYVPSVSGAQYLTIGRPNGSSITLTSAPTTTCNQYLPMPANTAEYYMLIDEVSVRPFDVLASASTSTVNVCGNVNLTASFSCGSGNLSSVGYNWTGPNLSNPSISNPVATVTTTSNYNVQAVGYDSNGLSCQANSPLTITSVTLNPLNLSSSASTVCPSGTVSISGSLTGGTGSYTYNPGNQVGNAVIFTPSVTTTYTVSGTGAGGCIQTKTITIYTYSSNVTATASPASICTGFSSTLTASNGSGFSWQPGTLSGNPVVVSPTVTTTYTLTGTTVNSCVRTNTVTVTVNNPSTMTVSPSSTNSICLNNSINLVASGATSYTWQPGNVINSNNPVTPTVNTTYTVYGTNSFGCIGSKTVSVFIYSLPTVVCSLTSASVCPNVTTTLNSSGATSYTWFPGNIVAQNPVVSQSVNTTYTVIGTSAQGCTNNCIVTQGVYPPNNFTVTATPSVVCGTTGGGPSTLIATPSSPSTYTWLPSNTASYSLAVTSTSISSPVYTVISTSSLGCIGTKTIQVAVSDGYATLSSFGPLCTTSTLNLTTYASPYPGGTFSVNGVSSGTLFSQPPGSYTIAFTNTTNLLCNQSATAAIQVFSVPATPTVSGTSTFLCGGQSLTLTSNPVGGAPYYVWPATTFTGNPYIFTPTVSGSYSVMAVNGACSVTSLNEFAFSATPLACNCVQNCSSSLSYTISFSPASNTVYCIPDHLYISGNVIFSNSDLKIAPGVSITVLPNSTLTLSGCHLYACDQMWKGITVQQGGKLIINSGTRTSFIEDAYVAVDLLATTSYTNSNILNIDNATFNRNQIGIRINDYKTDQTSYPFIIKNNLFTSRTLTYTSLSYQNTNTIKLSASGNTSALQTPYISSTYTPVALKSVAAFPDNGIVLNNVGYTNNNGNVWYNIIIGDATNANDFNCFDNLRQDITASNSNFKLTNNVFQTGQRYGKSSSSGGKSIVATSVTTGTTLATANNNQILIQSVSTNTALNNKFYEKVSCADITGYINTEIKYAEVYSYANNYNLFTVLNAIGDRGFNVTTNRYYNLFMQNNKFYNIKNPMLIGLDNGNYSVGVQSGSGRLVGNISVMDNLVDRHPGTPTSAEFINVGVSISDPFSSAPTTIISNGTSSSVIYNNKFLNVHNGAAAANIGFSGVSFRTNTITMVNEPSTYGTPTQVGINASQLLSNSDINQNNISGATSYSTGVKAISTSANALMAVRCNTTAYTARGLEFNGIQTITYLEDNTMSNQTYGLVLDNSAKLTSTLSTFVMGTSTRPTNNVWLNTWSVPNYKTLTTGGSSAQNGKLYVRYSSSTLDPDGSGNNFGGTIPGDNYYHTPVSGTLTLLSSSNVSPSCRISGGGGGESGRMMSDSTNEHIIALLQQSTTDSTIFNELSNEGSFINKNTVFRTLKANTSLMDNSASLNTFYNSIQNTSVKQLFDIEESIATGDFTIANSLLINFNPTNLAETNYKNFYLVCLNVKDSTFSSSDSLALESIAKSCPYNGGNIVHQARSLYNILYKTYKVFYDDCQNVASRKSNKVLSNIQVQLKTQLYPNPNNGNYTIRINGAKDKESVEICIFDMNGKLLIKEDKSVINKEIFLTQNLLNGTYTVKVKLADGTYDQHKIIISK